MSQLVRPACRCKRPLKIGAPGVCGYCGGRLPLPIGQRRGDALADLHSRTRVMAPLPAEDVYDATARPGVDEMPAQTTFMSADQFQEWIASPGKIYIVYLPGQKSFVVKVTDTHHDFFVAIVKQLRMQLGGDVQAIAAVAVDVPGTAPLADSDFDGVDIAPPTPPPGVHDVPAPHQQRWATCAGSGLTPASGTVRAGEDAGINERGECRCCGRDYQITAAGHIRLHREHPGDDDG